MKRRCLTLLAVMSLLAATARSQDGKKGREAASPAGGPAKGPDLRFTEEGADLIVSLMIEGPAARQVVLTDYSVDNGRPRTPSFEEELYSQVRDRRPPPQESPRRPSVWLGYLVIVDTDFPGFSDGGLMAAPTPLEERVRQRQEVKWRLSGFRDWGFRREDATFRVEATRFETSSEQLRQALPQIKKLVAEGDKLRTSPTP
jgi:hypothetical protein